MITCVIGQLIEFVRIVKYKVADILKGSTVQEPPTIGTFDILVK